jgi:hypothetical protein
MGPGAFLGVVWLAAALPGVWPYGPFEAGDRVWQWFRAGLATLVALFTLHGLGAVRIPRPSLPFDADRYVAEIEREFEGLPAESVLLDHGSWLYVPRGIVQKDRSAPVGESGWTQTADFGGLFERLRSHHYRRILVRDFHSPDFFYDYGLWEKPSGVRDSILHYYAEVRVIPAVTELDNPFLQPISVLEPRVAPDSATGERLSSRP